MVQSSGNPHNHSRSLADKVDQCTAKGQATCHARWTEHRKGEGYTSTNRPAVLNGLLTVMNLRDIGSCAAVITHSSGSKSNKEALSGYLARVSSYIISISGYSCRKPSAQSSYRNDQGEIHCPQRCATYDCHGGMEYQHLGNATACELGFNRRRGRRARGQLRRRTWRWQ